MKRFFKLTDEKLTTYIEFDEEYPNRQVNIRDKQWSRASLDYHPTQMLDQPLSAVEIY